MLKMNAQEQFISEFFRVHHIGNATVTSYTVHELEAAIWGLIFGKLLKNVAFIFEERGEITCKDFIATAQKRVRRNRKSKRMHSQHVAAECSDNKRALKNIKIITSLSETNLRSFDYLRIYEKETAFVAEINLNELDPVAWANLITSSVKAVADGQKRNDPKHNDIMTMFRLCLYEEDC